MRRVSLAFLVACLVAVGPASAAKNDVSQTYKNKFLVVMREGLVLGICSNSSIKESFLRVRITETGVDFGHHGIIDGMLDSDCQAAPQPLQKGEVIRSRHAAVRGKWLVICVGSISPHAVTRGLGAFQHESYETPQATLMFSAAGGPDELHSLVDGWVKAFDTQEEAGKFGNTASGIFVKEIRIGMSPAQVESVLGPPQTKIELGEKTLYKYKDMTVEFHEAKVADVR